MSVNPWRVLRDYIGIGGMDFSCPGDSGGGSIITSPWLGWCFSGGWQRDG